MSHKMQQAGGAFANLHATLMGAPIDWSGFAPDDFDPTLLARARNVWGHRAQTEFRSIQVMTRLLSDIVGAGDPIDVYAAVSDMISDEIRHCALCFEVCKALGATPLFPTPLQEPVPDDWKRAAAGERALHSAISMLLVNETLSVSFIRDLQQRCKTPGISDVLTATIADEAEHEGFGLTYVTASIQRFPPSTRSSWRRVVEMALRPHLEAIDVALAAVEPSRRHLGAFADEAQVALGLHSDQRLALVARATIDEVLRPSLQRLQLWPFS